MSWFTLRGALSGVVRPYWRLTRYLWRKWLEAWREARAEQRR